MQAQQVANLETLDVMQDFEFRQLHPHFVFPAALPAALLVELGYAVVEYDPEPALAPGEQLELGALRRDGNRVFMGWSIIPAPPVDWPALIAEQRYAHEISGIDVDGMRVDTDDRSKLLINGAALEAMIDPAYVRQWKTPAGFVELDAAQVQGVARAVRAHVQACFDREAELLAAVADGSITDQMLQQGWP